MAIAAAEKAKTNPDGMALADERQVVTWTQLNPWLNRATNNLVAGPATSGGRIAVFAPNSVENAMTYLAALHAGVSSVPVNFHFTAEEVAYILTDSGAKMVFVGPETVAVGREAATMAGIDA